jgi:hypothetical protein
MSISKRELYAAGEPLGDSVTTRKLGGGMVCGGGGSSSSSAQTTNNVDKRLVVGDGLGVTADNSSVSVNVTDGGIVSRALTTVELSNASLGEGYDKLIDTAAAMFDQSQGLIGQTQKSVADAYSQAQTNVSGTIDNKTITVLAIAGAAVAVAVLRKK